MPSIIGRQRTRNGLFHFILAMVMAALGLRTHYSAAREAGMKPPALAFILFLFLVIGGALSICLS